MKILMISTVKFIRNGITSVILNLVRELNRMGVDCDIFTISEPEDMLKDKLLNHGCKIYTFPRKKTNIIEYMSYLKNIIKENNYNIIHVHGNSATMILEMLAAFFAGCKVRIAHSHNTTCHYKWLNLIINPVFQLLCTNRIACGIEAGQWMFGKRDFLVVKNGIDLRRYTFNQELRKKMRFIYGLSDEDVLIGNVGLYNEQKNQIFLLEAFSKAVKVHPNIHLMLIGGGPLKSELINFVSEKSIESKVYFIDSTDKIRDYLCAIDCIAMPSLYEGLPLSVVEEQANGLKCILSSNITREVDLTGNITFISLEDRDSWSKILCEIKIDNNRDYASKIAVLKIKQSGYSIEEETRKLFNYYMSLIH